MPSSDAIIVVVVMVSCMFVISGLLLWKRFHSPKSLLRRLLRTVTLSFHPSDAPSILPSFEPCKASPFYASMRRISVFIMRKFGMKEMPGTEFDLILSTPFCLTPPNIHCLTLGSPQMDFTDANNVTSPASSSGPSPLLDGAHNDDRLPPNITIPIPRETALDRMMHRCRKDARKAGRTGNRDTPHIAYPQILEEIGDPPSIMVTLPSSTSAFPSRPSFAALLSTGPDKDPFFWDSAWLPCTTNRRAVPHRNPSSLPDQGQEARLDPAMRRIRRQGIRVLDHLAVPSDSGKNTSRGNRTPLGDSTNASSKPSNSPDGCDF